MKQGLAYLEPPTDGVFRAVPNGAASEQAGYINPSGLNRWVAVLNLTGELYEAFFETKEDASEAFYASGCA